MTKFVNEGDFQARAEDFYRFMEQPGVAEKIHEYHKNIVLDVVDSGVMEIRELMAEAFHKGETEEYERLKKGLRGIQEARRQAANEKWEWKTWEEWWYGKFRVRIPRKTKKWLKKKGADMRNFHFTAEPRRVQFPWLKGDAQ
jgi:hypothetical protein